MLQRVTPSLISKSKHKTQAATNAKQESNVVALIKLDLKEACLQRCWEFLVGKNFGNSAWVQIFVKLRWLMLTFCKDCKTCKI